MIMLLSFSRLITNCNNYPKSIHYTKKFTPLNNDKKLAYYWLTTFYIIQTDVTSSTPFYSHIMPFNNKSTAWYHFLYIIKKTLPIDKSVIKTTFFYYYETRLTPLDLLTCCARPQGFVIKNACNRPSFFHIFYSI